MWYRSLTSPKKINNELNSKRLVDETRDIRGTQFELNRNKNLHSRGKETMKIEGKEGAD